MKNIKFVCLLFAVLLFQNNQARAEEAISPAVTEQGTQASAEISAPAPVAEASASAVAQENVPVAEVSAPAVAQENAPAPVAEANAPAAEENEPVAAAEASASAVAQENVPVAEVSAPAVAQENVPVAEASAPEVAEQQTSSPSMVQTLSSLYGADVKMEIGEEICSLLYPEVKIEEDTPEFIAPTKPDEKPRIEHHIKTTVIPETLVKCEKIEDFAGKTQYKAAHTAPNKIIAQVYNLSSLDFLKDVEMKTFSEEFSFVPELGAVTAETLHIADASYTEKDETTGLKREIGNLKDLTIQQSIKQNGEEVKYKADMLLDTLNVAASIFSIQVKSNRQATEIDYKVEADSKFNYAEIWRNFENLVSSRSRALAQGVKLDISILGVNVAFDMDAKNQGNVDENGLLAISGNMVTDNIALVTGDMKEFQKLQSVTMQYSISGMQIKEFAKIISMQQDKMNNKEISDEALAKVLDGMVDTAAMTFDGAMHFTDADFSGSIQLQRKDGYLVGAGNIKISNLYNIFPALKACADPLKAADVPECSDKSFKDIFGATIDLAKNDSETVFTIDQNGVFQNGEKVGEPIELNFQKMAKEQEEKERRIKEQQEKMQQLMEKQQKELEVLSADVKAEETEAEPVAEEVTETLTESVAEEPAEAPIAPAVEEPAEATAEATVELTVSEPSETAAEEPTAEPAATEPTISSETAETDALPEVDNL